MMSRFSPYLVDGLRSHGSPAGRFGRLLLSIAASGILVALPSSARGQNSQDDDMQFRVGVTAGGIGLWGLSFEFRWGDRSIDTTIATFGFHDVSLDVTGKQYFGGGDLQPFVGLGLWSVNAFPDDPTHRTGHALLLRIPVGADWRFADAHSLGASLALNEGLWIRRADPEDDTPIGRRPVPLPGFYYRVTP